MKLLLLLALAVAIVPAATLYDVNLDTSQLAGHSAEPFSLFFQFVDGSGLGDANNTAEISRFSFDGGSASAMPVATGGASGDTNTLVRLTDTAFLSTFTQAFMPGAALSFRLMLTTEMDAGGTPDSFSFSILDSTGTELPTTALAEVGVDVILTADIAGPQPPIRAFGADPFRAPAAGGEFLSFAAPNVQVVPEPATLVCAGWSLALLLVLRRRGRRH